MTEVQYSSAATAQTIMDQSSAAVPPVSDEGALVPVPCAARLHDGETCYATTTAALLQEHNRVSRARYGGFSGNVRIARGISYRMGSYAVDQTRTSRLEYVATGELSITDQRLIFLSDTKNIDLPFSKLLSSSTEPGLIAVGRANAGLIVFDKLESRAVEVFEQVTNTPADSRLAIELQEYDTQEYGSLVPDEPSNILRNVLLGIALLLVVLLIRHTIFS